MFVVLITYTAPIEAIAEVFAEHQAWMSEQYAAGTFLLSGAQVPRTGAVIIARGTDRAVMEELVARDPVALAGFADYRVIEFAPTTTATGLEYLADPGTGKYDADGISTVVSASTD